MQNRNKQRFILLSIDRISKNPEKFLVNLDHIKYVRENTDTGSSSDDRAVLEFIDGRCCGVEESFIEVMDMIEESEQSCPTIPVLVENIHDAGIQ